MEPWHAIGRGHARGSGPHHAWRSFSRADGCPRWPYRPRCRMPARALPAAPRRPTRVLMAVHSAQRGGAQLVALRQARALRSEYDLVVSVGGGPLRAAFTEVATAVVRRPTSLPIWGASHRRWALQIGRAVPDAVRFAGLVLRHQIHVVVVNSTVLVAPVLGSRLARVPVIVHAQEAPTSAAATRLFRVHGALADTVDTGHRGDCTSLQRLRGANSRGGRVVRLCVTCFPRLGAGDRLREGLDPRPSAWRVGACGHALIGARIDIGWSRRRC